MDKRNNKITKNYYDELADEVTKEIEEYEDYVKSTFNDTAASKENLFTRVFKKMFGKLLTKLQFKITILWNGKEIFSYIIPKD